MADNSVSRDHVRQVLNEAYLGCAIAGVLGGADDHVWTSEMILADLWLAILDEPAPWTRENES